MTDQLTALRDSLETQAREAEAAFTPMADTSPSVRAAFDTMRKASRDLRVLANTTAMQVAKLEADDLTPEDGKQRLLAETRAAARDQYRKLQSKLDGATVVLEAAAHAAALPPIPRDREALVRDEAVLRMSNATNPVKALEEVARLGGEMSAIAASSWGESYLVAKGVPPREAKRLHREVVQVAAIDTATRSGDAKVAAAAKTYFALNTAKKASFIHLNLAGDDLKAAGVDWK